MKNKLILGTVQFGLDYGISNVAGKVQIDEAFHILDFAYQNDIRILDTAEQYGDAQKIIGNYHKNREHRFFVNSKFKVGWLPVERQIEQTLEEVKLETLNIYFYHSFGDFLKYPDLEKVLKELKTQGKIKKTGISVYDNQEFEKAINSDVIDVIQFPYNLLDNYNQRGAMIEKAKKAKKELQVRSVFLQGLFFMDINELSGNVSKLTPYLLHLKEIARDFKMEIRELALVYALNNINIDNVLLGVDSLKQLRQNINLDLYKSPDNSIKEINKIDVKEIELLYPKNW